MPRLRILFIAGWYPTKENPVNGVFVKEHAKAVSLYNDVIVLYDEIADSPVKDLYEISDEVEDDVRTVRVRYRKSPIPKTSYFIYLWSIFGAFRRLLKNGLKPDIIHAHVYFAGVPAVILGKIYKIPVVITEHFTGFPLHTLNKLDIFIAKFTMNKAKLILPVSDNLRKHIQSYGIRNKFKIVPNVVNTELFHPVSNTYRRATKRMLLVALLTPKKGVPYLLQALSKLKKKREDFTLDIVGDGPYRSEYEQQTQKLGITDRVQFHGLKPKKEEVAESMRRCDFFVLPSVFETFGVVLIEALASGKPVIATSIGGPSEIINEDTGLLVPPKNVDALAKAVDYMLDHYQEYSAEKISQYAKEKFSYEAVGRKLNNLYRHLINKKGGS